MTVNDDEVWKKM